MKHLVKYSLIYELSPIIKREVHYDNRQQLQEYNLEPLISMWHNDLEENKYQGIKIEDIEFLSPEKAMVTYRLIYELSPQREMELEQRELNLKELKNDISDYHNERFKSGKEEERENFGVKILSIN